MNPTELLEALLELAHEFGLEVRVAPSDGPAAGVARLRGRVFVVLAPGDPPDHCAALVAAALREHAADELEGRYLPPAVRAAIEG